MKKSNTKSHFKSHSYRTRARSVSDNTIRGICALYGIDPSPKKEIPTQNNRIRVNTNDEDYISLAKMNFATNHGLECNISKNNPLYKLRSKSR